MAARTIMFLAALMIGLSGPQPIDFAQVNAVLSRFSEQSLALIQRSFTPVKAETEPIDAKAAADLDEDLDWRIASGAKNDAALRAFLAKHPHGAHAVEAQLTLDKIIGQSPQPAPPSPPPKPVTVAVPLLTSPVVDVINAPQQPDVFAKLEEQQAPRTIIKWKHDRPRAVIEWRYARPRYRPPPPPQNFFAALFGPRQPRRWYVQSRW